MSTIKSSAENLTLNADGSGNDVLIQSNGSTKAIVTAESNAGLGTTSPSFENGTGLEIRYAGGNGAHLKLTDNASGAGGTNGFDLYAFNTSGYIENYEAGSLVFRNNGGERMRILAGGGLTFNGDTAAANALDDYEEGTWTPTITSTVAGINYAASVAQGKYTKIGRIVNASFLIVVTGVTNNGGNGNKKIDGLPFTQDGSSYAQVGILGYNDVFGTDVGSFYASGSDLQFIPAGVTQSNETGVITTGYLSGNITYIVS